LLAAPLWVATVATVAMAAPAPDRPAVTDAKLDKLHSARPIAAYSPHLPSSFDQPDVVMVLGLTATAPASPDPDLVATAPTAPDPDLVATAPLPASRWPTDTPAAVLACIRWRESRGDYTAHNWQGSGASGAYQFMPSTWDATATAAGRGDLVGIDPATASVADQDLLAELLLSTQGLQPWGGAC
jgi:hypothetical protein